jgi:alkanesulfonate monooxygenase SsuD/methylene tetrahydromethanopterin reductase-like flavin-dependent oxidoreductase (luciferase family)
MGEAVQIILAMWTQDEATFEGTYYQVHGAINQPKGVQRPHIPLLIGGSGEQVTLNLVAQYGDACDIFGDLATITRKLAVLKQHCEAVGREYESIWRTMTMMCAIGETDEQALASITDAEKAMIMKNKEWFGKSLAQDSSLAEGMTALATGGERSAFPFSEPSFGELATNVGNAGQRWNLLTFTAFLLRAQDRSVPLFRKSRAGLGDRDACSERRRWRRKRRTRQKDGQGTIWEGEGLPDFLYAGGAIVAESFSLCWVADQSVECLSTVGSLPRAW